MMFKSFICLVLGIFIYSSSFAQGKLIFAIDIVRHGDRTPIIASPEMEKIWPQGPGQLTPKGMRQTYDLGKKLREQYVTKYHLLPEHYDTNSMNVRASGTTRTLMSAQSILFGLYPLRTGPSLNDSTPALPEGFQPIPIDTAPREQDSLLQPTYYKGIYQQMVKNYVLNDSEWLQKDNELQSNYPVWSKIFAISIHHLSDLIELGDRLMIERLYDRPLPSGLLKQDADKIIDAGKWAFLNIVNHPKLALIVSRELTQTIKQEINLATKADRTLKYRLFVAHDSTIAAQLKLLGQAIDDIPPYASQLNYSIFDMGSSNYKVRVTYNHKLLFIEPCGGNTCTLNDFNNLIDNGLRQPAAFPASQKYVAK